MYSTELGPEQTGTKRFGCRLQTKALLIGTLLKGNSYEDIQSALSSPSPRIPGFARYPKLITTNELIKPSCLLLFARTHFQVDQGLGGRSWLQVFTVTAMGRTNKHWLPAVCLKQTKLFQSTTITKPSGQGGSCHFPDLPQIQICGFLQTLKVNWGSAHPN